MKERFHEWTPTDGHVACFRSECFCSDHITFFYPTGWLGTIYRGKYRQRQSSRVEGADVIRQIASSSHHQLHWLVTLMSQDHRDAKTPGTYDLLTFILSGKTRQLTQIKDDFTVVGFLHIGWRPLGRPNTNWGGTGLILCFMSWLGNWYSFSHLRVKIPHSKSFRLLLFRLCMSFQCKGFLLSLQFPPTIQKKKVIHSFVWGVCLSLWSSHLYLNGKGSIVHEQKLRTKVKHSFFCQEISEPEAQSIWLSLSFQGELSIPDRNKLMALNASACS